ncbi:MAG: B12-binding domain-containing radical SAM protein [bacterium]
MKVALIGAELEENLGIRYMARSLEDRGHETEIIPFNSESDIHNVVRQVLAFSPEIAGLSMVFTNRGREFCHLAQALREDGYGGHLIAGGPFASFNCENLLLDFPSFNSIALGEGERLICDLAYHLDDISKIPGLCYRGKNGTIKTNPSIGGPDNLDSLAFPKRISFHTYFDKKIASILTSRGCWRNCAFCSISAWYDRIGGKKFRFRSIPNIVAEMKELYEEHGVRIFNFQDDNFFLPDKDKALQHFKTLRKNLDKEGIKDIAIAIKARPDSITRESISVLNDLGLFRVFLGVENASENGLYHLNRKSTIDQALNALEILNDFDVHIAYNLLMFEPDTVMEDILVNLRFIERHIENPFNFCRAEAHAGTGLESKLKAEGKLLGNYFGLDYRLKDPSCEAFHQIANYGFFDRNFSDHGLHYFNMQVDFIFQLLKRFYPELLTQSLRAVVRSFIKETNIDTYKSLCEIYDFIESIDPNDQAAIQNFARQIRAVVDSRSMALHAHGESILNWLDNVYELRGLERKKIIRQQRIFMGHSVMSSTSLNNFDVPKDYAYTSSQNEVTDLFGLLRSPIPYQAFKMQLSRQSENRR